MSRDHVRDALTPARPGSEKTEGPEGLRGTLESRLMIFGRWGFWILGAYALLDSALVAVFGGGEHEFTEIVEGLSIPIVFGCLWLTVRATHASFVTLRVFDALATFVVALLFSVLARELTLASAFMPITYLAILRAAIVPSSARTTIGVTTLALLPALVLGFFLPESWGGPKELGDAPKFVLFLARCAIVCGTSAAISHTFHGLRRQVRDARKVGRYRLEKKIGEGGMGQVYRASHDLLRRPTAVKILRPDTADEETLGRFEREVQLTSRLTHPSTVEVYDYGRNEDGTFYYAMEYLPGLDLLRLVRQHGPQPPARVIHILRQACGSLYEAHCAGMVHRDIKPPNLILCERGRVCDVVKVLDFGLAKNLHDDLAKTGAIQLTKDNVVLGTPRYMAPESLTAGAKVGPLVDIYALGLVGYFLLTGKHAIGGDDFMEIFVTQMNVVPKRPSEILGSPIPEDLEDVLRHCVEKAPANRPQDARRLSRALELCDDANKWSQDDAEEWWRQHASKGVARR